MVSLALIPSLSGPDFLDNIFQKLTPRVITSPGLLLLVDTSLIQNSKQLQECGYKTIKVQWYNSDFYRWMTEAVAVLQFRWDSISTGTADLVNSYLAQLLSSAPRLLGHCVVRLVEIHTWPKMPGTSLMSTLNVLANIMDKRYTECLCTRWIKWHAYAD